MWAFNKAEAMWTTVPRPNEVRSTYYNLNYNLNSSLYFQGLLETQTHGVKPTGTCWEMSSVLRSEIAIKATASNGQRIYEWSMTLYFSESLNLVNKLFFVCQLIDSIHLKLARLLDLLHLDQTKTYLKQKSIFTNLHYWPLLLFLSPPLIFTYN